MDVLDLIAEARSSGLQLLADGDRLVIRGPRAAEPVVKMLRNHKAEALAALACEANDPQIAWRVAILRPYVRPFGPIWLPPVRPGIKSLRDAPDRCASCGEPKTPTQRYHCLTCQHARWQAVYGYGYRF